MKKYIDNLREESIIFIVGQRKSKSKVIYQKRKNKKGNTSRKESRRGDEIWECQIW